MTPLLDVRDLSYRYPDGTLALDHVRLSLWEAETVVLLGPNGAGKTTFALHLNGLLRGEGEIEVCGTRLGDETLREIRRSVGLLFQDPDDQLFMPTVLEDVAFAPLNMRMSGHDAMRVAREALERVGMGAAEAKAPYHLSLGEKRRVALAGVLAAQPRILVLDEPTTYLDPRGRRELVELLSALGQPKIIVTHDSEFARRTGTRAVFFERGRIVAEGPVSRILSDFDWA